MRVYQVLVKTGYAFDFKKYSKKKYNGKEIYAKENNLGLWTRNFYILGNGEQKLENIEKIKVL